MKRWLAGLVLFTLALAHPLTGEGPVMGDLKFEPVDQPKAGVELVTYLDFVTINEIRLNLLECRCTLMAYQGQASAQAKPDIIMQFKSNGKRIEGKLTFPKPGPYVIVVLGRPEPGSKLPPFMLTSILVVN